MPTNVSPEYKKVEQAFRAAREPAERLRYLKEMLRTIPKHKGTEHLQSDIKRRIKQMTSEIMVDRRRGGRSGPSYSVHPAGAAQVVLVGPPNSGKSSLHARLTRSHTEVGPYPFTTHAPVPGMLPHEDIHFQLVDLPAVSDEFMEPWFHNAVQRADAALLVVDVNDAACVEQVPVVLTRLAERKITLEERWPGLPCDGTRPGPAPGGEDVVEDPFRIALPTLLVGNKSDLDPEPDEVNVLEDLLGVRYPAVSTSAVTGQGLDALGPLLFEGLRIVRVYTKAPGRPPEHERPFTVRRGQTVHDVARMVHKEIAGTLKFARLWGSSAFDGQHVGPEHEVADGDIVELHAS